MHFRISSSVAFFISSATALSWKVCTSLSVRFLPSMKCSLNYLLQLLYKLWGGSFSLLKPLIEVSIFPLVSRTIALFCFQFDNECMIKEECPTILELLVGTLLRVCCKGWAEIANCPWKLRFIWAFFKSFSQRRVLLGLLTAFSFLFLTIIFVVFLCRLNLWTFLLLLISCFDNCFFTSPIDFLLYNVNCQKKTSINLFTKDRLYLKPPIHRVSTVEVWKPVLVCSCNK